MGRVWWTVQVGVNDESDLEAVHEAIEVALDGLMHALVEEPVARDASISLVRPDAEGRAVGVEM